MTQLIRELFAWVVDDPTGTHGIIGVKVGSGMAQAVTSKRRIAEQLTPDAMDAARITGLPVRLIRFTAAEIVESVGSVCE